MHASLVWRNPFLADLQRTLPARPLHYLFLYAIPLALALAAAVLPPDANFDLANYHWYNGWAFLTGHGRPDFAPGGNASYYNPLLDAAFAWANMHLPERAVAFLLGLSHSACFALLYLLARTMAFRARTIADVAAAGAIALAGITAAVSIAEIGTTFYDAFGAAGVLLALLLLARHTLDGDTGIGKVILAGALLGLMTGFKLTNGVYAAGFTVAIPFLSPNQPKRALVCTAAFAAGALAGLLATGGLWMLHLWTIYGDPIFPYFNNIFHTSLAPANDARDVRFLPHGWLETLFYPFIFTVHPLRTIEVAMRDFRFLAFFLALPAGALLLFANRHRIRSPGEDRRRALFVFLLIGLTVSYAGWLAVFAIRRYGLVFEMLAPLMILLVGLERPEIGKKVAAAVIAAVVLTTMPATMGRGTWTNWNAHLVDAHLPKDVATANSEVVMIGWRPKAFLVPFFPETARFVDAGVYKLRAPGAHDQVARQISAYHGPRFALVHQTELPDLASLRSFGLAAGACRPIHSTLDIKGPVLLCPAKPI
jgi:hypothetical protein